MTEIFVGDTRGAEAYQVYNELIRIDQRMKKQPAPIIQPEVNFSMLECLFVLQYLSCCHKFWSMSAAKCGTTTMLGFRTSFLAPWCHKR